ncbi:MAG TPA: 2-C-methyl-D-erythritol 4-phosphate cytidylyltransferase [Vicinamibacteria bacterium]|nr:2-C-methyl-D-erythritol 4-phosphate cytidylyltransferase [Vicinamibacteria bacterium]
MSSSSIAVLVAAGRGERMGAGRAKAFLPLAGRALLLRAAEAFEAAPEVEAIVAVVPADEQRAARDLLAPLRKVTAVVAGGATRQDSVRAGLEALPSAFDGIVLVHDAARALIEPALIASVVRAAAETGAAIPVLPLVDTIKRVRDGAVGETLDRSELAAAQTPQGVRRALLQEALDEAARKGITVTDEAMAVEHLGRRVAAVVGSPRNLKITTPHDLRWAELLLASTVEKA